MLPTSRQIINPDLQNEIASKRRIITKIKATLRQLEEQMATFSGHYVPPFITQQIEDLTNQISIKEEEPARLETQSVQGELPLAEVEFRVLIAEAWKISSGWLDIAEKTRLELCRLRLRISEETSIKHHTFVRQRLAKESLRDLDLNNIQRETEKQEEAVNRIIRGFRFDPQITEDILRLNVDDKSANFLADWITKTGLIWKDKYEYIQVQALFQRLLERFKTTRLLYNLSDQTPMLWEGSYKDATSGSIYPMQLHIDRIHERGFYGHIKWTNKNHRINRLVGLQIYEFKERNSQWAQLSNPISQQSAIFLNFTETDCIEGDFTELKGDYIAVLYEDGPLSGLYFPSRDYNTYAGAFQLSPKPLISK